ncbi:MAG: hypothetical protein L3J00_07220 [Thiomicrorhabdus sp.]|nr:hypothetical protein [Thiomicrorhabdus sp.]
MKIHKLFYAAFIQLLMVGTAFASPENPSFKNNILTINAVDADSQLGKYQDVMFQLTEQGEWKLLDYRVGNLIPNQVDDFFGIGLDAVELITTDAYPIQVFLKVSATLACDGIGQISQKFVGNAFEVFVYYEKDNIDSNSMSCIAPQSTGNHVKIIELPVYGLPAGEYTYNVNGDFSGSFNLTSDNELIGY